MPSYVIHLSCAKKILEQTSRGWGEQEKNLFYLGNIMADMSKEKRLTHFWDDETYKKLVRRPNLQMFLQKYQADLDHPYVCGYYAHLYLDCMFLDTYWKNHFRFYGRNRELEDRYESVCYVEVVEQNKMYDRTDFFSGKWYYGDYDTMNAYFIHKYQLEFPDLNLTPQETMEISKIEEIDLGYAMQALEDAKDMLFSGTKKPADAGCGLRIFRLGDLEMLVERTAKEMADM